MICDGANFRTMTHPPLIALSVPVYGHVKPPGLHRRPSRPYPGPLPAGEGRLPSEPAWDRPHPGPLPAGEGERSSRLFSPTLASLQRAMAALQRELSGDQRYRTAGSVYREIRRWADRDCEGGRGRESLVPDETANIPHMWGKVEQTGRHGLRSVLVSAHTAATASRHHSWRKPPPTTHGIHDPPRRDAVTGGKLRSRCPTYTADVLACQPGNYDVPSFNLLARSHPCPPHPALSRRARVSVASLLAEKATPSPGITQASDAA
jgi:hypothetical protein